MTQTQLNIAVSSMSAVKVDAVREVFSSHFKQKPEQESSPIIVTVEGYSAKSGVNEQPVGNEETMKGAKNRMVDMLQQINTKTDLSVSIENGIMEISGTWYDVGWILVETKSGRSCFVPTAGVPFPSDVVVETLAVGVDKTTVGSVLMSSGVVFNNQDPHSDLTNKMTSRTELLQQALRIAIGILKI